jgi:hypothetical protein
MTSITKKYMHWEKMYMCTIYALYVKDTLKHFCTFYSGSSFEVTPNFLGYAIYYRMAIIIHISFRVKLFSCIGRRLEMITWHIIIYLKTMMQIDFSQTKISSESV